MCIIHIRKRGCHGQNIRYRYFEPRRWGAGLTLAIGLARRHIAFRVIDQLDDPFRGSRGKGIQPRSQEIFEDLGILDRVVAAGGLYPPQREYRSDGGFEDAPMFEMTDPTPAEPYHTPF